ncbi:hypothetical protein C8R45DRAFT_891557 [Mycena sanguinolenta]|nr:hypothetical protein C8R45DRAFT_891557 [Mycena sanguinolenta]
MPAAEGEPEVAKRPKKSKKSKDVVTASALEPVSIDETEEVAQPPTKSKKPKHAPEPQPESEPLAEAEVVKRSKKSKKSTAAVPEAAVKPSKPSKKSKAAIPQPESVVTQPAKKSKQSKPVPVPEPEPELTLADEAADSDSSEDEPLHGFSTDDDDSSDDDGYMDVEVSAFDVAKLPTIAKDDATVKRKLENAKRQPTADRGVLFLGRIPHGFYEEQLKAYFTQFGNVTRLRVSRNKKTGQSKHYGFIEFDSSSVAQIVADTMDNYLLMGHILRCKVIPKDQVHPELWVGANRRWRPVPTVRVAQAEHNKLRTKDEQMRANHRLLKRQQERQRKLEKAGIKYDLGEAGYKLAKVIEV